MAHVDALHVGLAVKRSRYDEFKARNFFKEVQAPWVDLSSSSETWPSFHILLHKVSDAADKEGLGGLDSAIANLARYVQRVSKCVLIDDCGQVTKVFDRIKLCELLDGLKVQHGNRALRQPNYVQASNSLRHHLSARAKEAGIHLPCIVKSAAACGATDAHRMTILTNWKQTESLSIPEEAVLQQFHNHGGWLHKVYVIGNKVHMVKKRSLQDIQISESIVENSAFYFDSLDASAYKGGHEAAAEGDSQSLCIELVDQAVEWLQKQLRLTLFGFDIVVAYSGDHYIVDVNYFPSFKEIESAPEDIAAAIRQAFAERQGSKEN